MGKAIFEEYIERFQQLIDETFGSPDQMEDDDVKLKDGALSTFRQSLQDISDTRVEKNSQCTASGQVKLLVAASGTTGVLWLRKHPYIVFASMGGYGAVHAGNASVRAKAEGGTTTERMLMDWKALII